MIRKILISNQAKRDLDEIWLHIASDDIDAAGRITERIGESVQHLKAHPELGRPGRVRGTRELVVSGAPFVVA